MHIQYESNLEHIRPSAARLVRRMITAWLGAAGMELLLSPGSLAALSTIASLSPLRLTLMAAAIFTILHFLPEKAQRWALPVAFLPLMGSLFTSFTWLYLAACLLILSILIVYAIKGWAYTPSRSLTRAAEKPLYFWLTVAVGIFFFVFVSVWTVCRVWSFSVPTFDFTIFAQMFHNMKETGLPMTTVERDGPLSHFAVHVSPIYYLLLPFYCIVPRPATLQVLQAAVLASAFIPLWKLGRHHGLAPWVRFLLCLVLALYPSYAGGVSYDIHENAFLTPLILWLFYGLDRRSIPTTVIAAALTCMVKEDAAVYVAVIGLWQIARGCLFKTKNWNLAAGLCLIAGSVAYFLAVTGYLAQSGDGVMTGRYRNFMYDGSDSLFTVIKAVLLCPMKAVYEAADPEKLEFLGLTMGVLMGLPLMTRRYERYTLLIPYLLVNLMSDYQYQHNIFFQYTYGATACLLYLAMVNLADLKRGRLYILTAVIAASGVCFLLNVVPKASNYPMYCRVYAETYAQRRETLALIPEDASVAATTFYTAPLSSRETLYDVKYASEDHILGCEFVVLNPKDTTSFKKYGSKDAFVAMLEENGYTLHAELEGQILIYRAAQ